MGDMIDEMPVGRHDDRSIDAGKVLVIDDEENICKSCAEVLQDDGYAVTTFTKPNDALKYLRDEDIDLVLLDLKMPEADGIEVLKQLRAHHRETLVVVITGYASVETAVASLKLGAFDYVSKPFTPDELSLAAKRAFEHKRLVADYRKMNEQRLMRSEKLASIGRLAAGIAHEINNPLTSVLTFSSLLLRKAETGDQKEKLEIIVKETTRCRQIVRDLLNFARLGEPKKEECSINQIIESALSLTKNQLKMSEMRIAVKKELEELPLLQLDPDQMLEVFVNIIINAIDAMPQGGELNFTTRLAQGGKAVEIRASDTGYGIPRENLAKVFDPFFTTKDAGKGTGLGLSVTYGIIDRHNGTIDVESEVRKGTTFIIKLPLE
jgi:signal transduction histidine kinase